MVDGNEPRDLLSLTTEIVAGFVGGNTVAASDLPMLVTSVFQALRLAGHAEPAREPDAPVPAVPIKKSVGRDYVICLEDGKKLKMLKRHLATRYQMTPAEYRQRWGLPKDYPMVAPAYAEARSQLAKSIGLGRPRKAVPSVTAPAAMGPIRRAAGRRKAASPTA
jgi:predicted transcriptional regulator